MAWLDAARHAVEHKAFVMVEPDGSWHPPTGADWNGLDSPECHGLDVDPVRRVRRSPRLRRMRPRLDRARLGDVD